LDKEVNMRKGFFAICLASAIAVALIAVFVPSCIPTEKGTIEVKATLCSDPWPAAGDGAVNYTLTLAGGTSPINGTEVPKTYTVDVGTWTCAYVDGGPAGAFRVDITPSATQTVSDGDTLTFTLNFELYQDGWIEFLTWTINGDPIGEPDKPVEHQVTLCETIDVHFKQGVDGCEGKVAAVNETSRLWIHYDGYEVEPGIPGDPPSVVWLNVVNDECAVNKTAEGDIAKPDKGEQVLEFKEYVVYAGGEPIPLEFCDDTAYLDVETEWWLEKCFNYTKSINWFGVSIDPEMHPCVVFDLLFTPPVPGWYHFTLVASAEVTLTDDEDVNPWNSHAESPPLGLWVCVPAGP